MLKTDVLSRFSPLVRASKRAMLRAALVAALFGLTPLAATAQNASDQTLADIRQELSVVYVIVQRLKRELSTTQAPGTDLGGATSVLDRVNAIESALQTLTARTEALENRIDRIVIDGTNRIGDLEFRLVELEGGDLSTLGETTTLGGDLPETASLPGVIQEPSEGAQLAVGEQADFDAARDALDTGAFEDAVLAFTRFNEAYPDGPFARQADILRGDAHQGMGETANAARAYLSAFSSDPAGTHAPQALYKLGTSLGALGQTDQACLTLGEVGIRFPGSEQVARAEASSRTLGCS